jgi:hypothetical protein
VADAEVDVEVELEVMVARVVCVKDANVDWEEGRGADFVTELEIEEETDELDTRLVELGVLLAKVVVGMRVELVEDISLDDFVEVGSVWVLDVVVVGSSWVLDLVLVSLVDELDGELLAAGVELAETMVVDGVGELDGVAVIMTVTGGALMSITEYLVVVTCDVLADGVIVTTSVSVVLGPAIVWVETI